MEKLQLISVRLDPALVAEIDKIAKGSRGMKRSYVIHKLLDVVINCASAGTLLKMLSSYEPHRSGYTVHFDVDREKLAQPSYDD